MLHCKPAVARGLVGVVAVKCQVVVAAVKCQKGPGLATTEP